ncbi:hypothetical protein [Pseudomonas defluvii]|uniref:hypothetical protein n=1 Tax=Pseudomonas defluvii TaxID=1876757 RepID=UPI0039061C2C
MARIIVLATAVMLGGCSITYKGNDGVEHSFGLVYQKTKATDEMIYLEKHYYGVSLNLVPDDAGATIGYKNSVRVFVPEDAILTIDNPADDIKARLDKFGEN